MSGVRRFAIPVIAALATLALAVAVAWAQSIPAPSLTADSVFAPPSGIARFDFSSGTVEDIPAAVAIYGERIYTVGSTRGGSGGRDMGIVAHRTNGTLDTGFSDDGKLIVSIAPTTETDFATGIAVLPDGRIRVVGSTDKTAGAGESLDIAIVGLNPDGTPDTTFGELNAQGTARTGRIVFAAGPAADVAARIVAGPDGRLAIVGSRSEASRDDVFVSLREPDGTPVTSFGTNGVRFLNRGGVVNGVSLVDRGVDVVFRPGGGLVALVLVETNPGSATDFNAVLHAFALDGSDDTTFSGDADLVIPAGDPDTVPGGLVVHDGRLWAVGYTKVAADTDAFLARMQNDGGDVQVRRFDMRGRTVAADLAVVSRALDVAVVPGSPDTLVAAGSIDYSSAGSTTTEWAAAAFNNLGGDLAQAGFGDLVLPAPGQGGLLTAAAGGDRSVAVAGTHIDTTSSDNSFGIARLLVDAEKSCDLAIAVGEPAELVFTGTQPAALTARVTNNGTRSCAGTIEVPEPYRMTPAATGEIAPGATFTASAVPISFAGQRRAEDILRVSVSSSADANTANNQAAAHVVFRYCDLSVRLDEGVGAIPREGRRRFELALRNSGTVSCRVRVGSDAPYRLAAGRSVSDELALAAPKGARRGTRVPVVLRASADDDVDTANNAVTVRPTVIDVGDSAVTRAGARSFAGTASGGKGQLARKRLRVTSVHVAVLRKRGKTCAWLRSAGGFTSSSVSNCDKPRWLRARGTARWRLRLPSALPRGGYVAYSRATIAAGFAEARFSARDRNRVAFRVR